MLGFIISYRKNLGLLLSPFELINLYFYGINLQNKEGTDMDTEDIITYILSAQELIEADFGIKLVKKIIEEKESYYKKDFDQWGFVPTSFPVLKACKLSGFFGAIRQIEYPEEWLSVRGSSEDFYHRSIYLVPSSLAAGSASPVIYSGTARILHLQGNLNVPHYWTIRYCSGFTKFSNDLLDFVGKLASLQIFNVMGDIVLGVGIANMSIGLDGLSQSIGTTRSAENAAYSARIKMYVEEFKRNTPILRAKYKGITLMAC